MLKFIPRNVPYLANETQISQPQILTFHCRRPKSQFRFGDTNLDVCLTRLGAEEHRGRVKRCRGTALCLRGSIVCHSRGFRRTNGEIPDKQVQSSGNKIKRICYDFCELILVGLIVRYTNYNCISHIIC